MRGYVITKSNRRIAKPNFVPDNHPISTHAMTWRVCLMHSEDAQKQLAQTFLWIIISSPPTETYKKYWVLEIRQKITLGARGFFCVAKLLSAGAMPRKTTPLLRSVTKNRLSCDWFFSSQADQAIFHWKLYHFFLFFSYLFVRGIFKTLSVTVLRNNKGR